MVNLTVLVSGSAANAVVAASKKTAILLDCGLPAKSLYSALAHRGFFPEQIDAICLTHAHADHSAGIRAFAKEFNVPVLMTAGTFRQIAWGFVPLTCPVDIGDLSIHHFEVSHDAEEPVGFVLETRHDGDRAGYLVDTGYIEPHYRPYLLGCRELLIESNHDTDMLAAGPYHPSVKARVSGPLGHLSNEQVAEFIKHEMPRSVKRLILGHISSTANTPGLAMAVAARAVKRAGLQLNLEAA